MSKEFLGLLGLLVLAVIVAVRFQRRWMRLRSHYRRLEEYADTLLQHGQGTILHVQGIVSELREDDPLRQRVEHALSRAERDLTEFRETMQSHCSQPQHERIQ